MYNESLSRKLHRFLRCVEMEIVRESPKHPRTCNSTVEMGETTTLIIREDATVTMMIVVAGMKSDSDVNNTRDIPAPPLNNIQELFFFLKSTYNTP